MISTPTLIFGAVTAICLQCTVARAGCFDADYLAKAFPSQRLVEICQADRCEDAILVGLCTEQDFSSADYETSSAHWFFHLKFNGTGDQDDEFSLRRNDAKLTTAAAKNLTCKLERGREGCEIIDAFLNKLR